MREKALTKGAFASPITGALRPIGLDLKRVLLTVLTIAPSIVRYDVSFRKYRIFFLVCLKRTLSVTGHLARRIFLAERVAYY